MGGPPPKCRAEACGKQANFGLPGTTGAKNRTYCAEHGRPLGLVDIVNKRCEHEGCDTMPTFGVRDTKKATHCASHGVPLDLVNVKDPTCQQDGCNVTPTFKAPGANKYTFCAKHAPEGSESRMKPTCEIADCGKSACYAVSSGEKARFCKAHGIEKGMKDIVHSMCAAPDCQSRASYGEEGSTKRTHCGRHGKALGLVNIDSKRCQIEGCKTVPIFGPQGTTIGIMCKAHGEELGYVDVRNPTCVFEKDGIRCQTQLRQGFTFCADHDTVQKRSHKTAEAKLREWLRINIAIPWTYHDRQVMQRDCDCAYRPDFLWELDSHIVVVEHDEAFVFCQKTCQVNVMYKFVCRAVVRA